MIHYPYRRRQFFIKREFQIKFILIYAVTLVSLAGLTTWILSLNINRALEWHIYSSHLKVERTGEFISGLLFETNLVAILAIVALVTLLSMIVVKRLNLHFHRLCETIDRLTAGDFGGSKPSLSRFNEISLVIDMADALKTSTQTRYEHLAAALEQVTRGCETADKDALQSARALLLKELSRVSLPNQA